MNTTSNRHLTHLSHLSEDQIDDMLIGDLAPEPAAHLKQCVECQAQLEAAKAPMASFAAVSMAWSERQSATAPITLVQAANSAGQRQANWVAAATAMLLLAVSIPLTMRDKQTQVVASDTVAQTTAKPAVGQQTSANAGQARVQPLAMVHHEHPAAELAHDNEMLQAINRELDASVQSPSDNFGLMAVGGTAAHGRNAPVQTWD
jgi:hypothetical protein